MYSAIALLGWSYLFIYRALAAVRVWLGGTGSISLDAICASRQLDSRDVMASEDVPCHSTPLNRETESQCSASAERRPGRGATEGGYRYCRGRVVWCSTGSGSCLREQDRMREGARNENET